MTYYWTCPKCGHKNYRIGDLEGMQALMDCCNAEGCMSGPDMAPFKKDEEVQNVTK